MNSDSERKDHRRKAWRYPVAGCLLAIAALVLLIVWRYPVFLDTGRTFGPDNTPWREYVLPLLAYLGVIAALIGCGTGLLVCWIMKRVRSHV